MNHATRARRAAERGNPWGLYPAVERVLDAVVQTGTNKGAARALTLAPATITDHMKTAKRSINAKGSRLQTVLAWDRWRQQQKAGQ